MENIDFTAIKNAIDQFAELIKSFTKIIKDFVASWKKEWTYGEKE